VKFSKQKRDASADLIYLKDAYNSPVLLFDDDIVTHMDRFVTGSREWMHQVTTLAFFSVLLANVPTSIYFVIRI
jgi:hypothetical protein